MSTDDDRTRTTVYLETTDYRRLQAIARAEGRSTAQLVREAVAQYAARYGTVQRPRSLATGHSGRGDVAERAEDLLAGMGSDE